jgi:thiol-disulfide isomerase/thioredoxin
MTGVWALAVVLLVTAVIALAKLRVDGRFRPRRPSKAADPQSRDDVLTVEEIGGPLGQRMTFVQFSSSFCSPCRATRVLLADVVRSREGIAHVEVDAESNLDLVRRLNILRTPTVVVLDAEGGIVGRASGLPRREQVEATITATVGA